MANSADSSPRLSESVKSVGEDEANLLPDDGGNGSSAEREADRRIETTEGDADGTKAADTNHDGKSVDADETDGGQLGVQEGAEAAAAAAPCGASAPEPGAGVLPTSAIPPMSGSLEMSANPQLDSKVSREGDERGVKRPCGRAEGAAACSPPRAQPELEIITK